jgi:hypothetical protein
MRTKLHHFWIWFMMSIALAALIAWIWVFAELHSLGVPIHKTIMLILLPPFFGFWIWFLRWNFKRYKRHIERQEAEVIHHQQIRHEYDKQELAKGNIPKHINFKNDPYLEQNTPNKSSPGILEMAKSALAEKVASDAYKEKQQSKKGKK